MKASAPQFKFWRAHAECEGKGMSKKTLLFVVLVWGLLAEARPQAYLDPGSGSMLLQILLGGFAAVGVIVKLYWHRVTSLFGRKTTMPLDPGAS